MLKISETNYTEWPNSLVVLCLVFLLQKQEEEEEEKKQQKKTLSHFSAHVVNRLLRENWKSILKVLSGKKLLKNVTLQILILSK